MENKMIIETLVEAVKSGKLSLAKIPSAYKAQVAEKL